MASKVIILVCILSTSIAFIPSIFASDILMFPLSHGGGSHYKVMLKVAEELLDRGHNVTMLLEDYLANKQRDKVEERIHFLFSKSDISKEEYDDAFRSMTNAGLKGEYIKWLIEFSRTNRTKRRVLTCRFIFENEELMSKLVNSNFALAVTDNSQQCPLVQFLRKYHGVPFVVISPISTLISFNFVEIRSPFNPSYMPELTSGLDNRMEFNDRLYNIAKCILSMFVFALYSNPFYSVRKDFGIADTGAYYSDAELLLMNTNFALDFPRPSLPNTVAVGGLTSGPAKPLSREWLEYLESVGEEGVVLFSMGSYASGIDGEVAALFAGAFAQIPQKVIWKLNGKSSASLSANVKVVNWVPQNDLLAHPKIKALVYHCGMNGVWEAVYHGVPMVALPLFADQHDNAQRLVTKGMAIKVDITTLTSDELANAIRTVASEPSFKKNAKRVSAIFRDTPRTPTETAGDWLEYVIRHGDASHLRSAALDLNIFQYFLLDVAAVILLACIVFIAIVFCSCKLCFKGCRSLCYGSSGKIKNE